MKKIYCTYLILFVALFHSCDNKGNRDFSAYETLSLEFKDPQGTARAKTYWWWINGCMDTLRMRQELHAIKAAGLGGVDIFEIGFRPDGIVPPGPPFMGDESLNGITFAIREAGRLGLEVGLNLSSSWNAGGSWIKPEHAAKSLYFSEMKITGGGQQQITLPFPAISRKDAQGRELIELADDGRPLFREEIAVLAIPAGLEGDFLDTARIVNVSRFFDSAKDVLDWHVPSGEWKICRYVCSNSGDQLMLPSPASTGPIIDHFDASATETHFMYFINRLQPVLGEFPKTALKNFYLASFEARGAVWTPLLAAKFKELNGYEIYKFLPYIFNKKAFAPEIAESFRQDFGITISELMINNHYGKGKEVAGKYGLNLISESGGPGPPLHNVPVDGIKALGVLSIPRGEYWIDHSVYDGTPDSVNLLMLVKEVSAAAHIYGRKIAELEAFTSFKNWQEGPGDMKPIGDRAFCEGMNRPVIHGFTHNPSWAGFPGLVYNAGTHYNDKTTWFSKSKPFNDYLARISYILQEADFVADVLYYYGEPVPNFVRPKNIPFAAGSGYDYEVIDTEKFLNDLAFENGMLTLPYGARFKILALGKLIGKNGAILKKLQELANQGAIITGIRPEKPVAENQALVDRLWTSEPFKGKSKGRIYETPTSEILQMLNVPPDFDYPDKQSSRLDYQTKNSPVLDYIHYQKGDLDFYLVRNTRNQTVSRLCSFRQNGKSPEIWHPVTGEIIPVSVYNQTGRHIDIPLTFAPYSSYFVVFGESRTGHFTAISSSVHPPQIEYVQDGILFHENGKYTLNHGSKATSIDNIVNTLALTGEWTVRFDKNWGGPEQVQFPELISWSDSPDEGIKYYSGTATYAKTFTFDKPAEGSIFLDLGRVEEVADVWMNGQPLGIVWTPPYRFDVTDVLKQGENMLRIEVINTWNNRIVGDITGNHPKKYTWTNVDTYSKTRSPNNVLWKDTPLMESGLLGPVCIQTLNIVSN